MNFTKLVGVIHVAMVLFCAFFFLIPKSRFDFLYLLYTYGVYWTWTMFNGHCPISYLVKEPDEISTVSKDITLLFGAKHENLINTLKYISFVFAVFSLFTVFRRNKMNVVVGITPIFLYYGLSYLQRPAINITFWVVFLVYMVDCIKRFAKA